MKYKVKYNDDGVKIDAILRIKDDSFVVTYTDKSILIKKNFYNYRITF